MKHAPKVLAFRALHAANGTAAVLYFDYFQKIFALAFYTSTKMSEKKRKRYEERPNGRPSKRVATGSSSQNIKISLIEDGDEWVPVLGECDWSFCWLCTYLQL